MAEPGCLHDAHFQNLEASDVTLTNLTLTGTFNSNLEVVIIDPSTGTHATPNTEAAPTFSLKANSLNILTKTSEAPNPCVLDLPSITGCAAGTVVQVMLAANQGVLAKRTEIRSKVGEPLKLFGVITLRQNPALTDAEGADSRPAQDMTIVVASGPAATARVGATRINLCAGANEGIADHAGNRGGQLQFVNRNQEYWWVTGSLILGNACANTLVNMDEANGTNAFADPTGGAAATLHICTA
jgi:hypothetical protein